MAKTPDFIASYWTTAGDCHPVRDAGISKLPIDRRVKAAAAAGYKGFSFSDQDLKIIRQDPKWRSYKDISKLLRDNGITFVELEALHEWFAEGDRAPIAEDVLVMLLEAAEELQAGYIKASGDLSHGFPLDRMPEPFAKLCKRVSDAGTRVALEPTPLANLVTPEHGLKLIRDSGAKNAGLMLDLWHLGRAGVVYETLSDIPLSLIAGVEIEDADKEVRGTLMDDTMNHRRQCGEGDLDCLRFLKVMQGMGYAGMYGIEMVSEAHRALSVEDATRVAIQAARRQFEKLAA